MKNNIIKSKKVISIFFIFIISVSIIVINKMNAKAVQIISGNDSPATAYEITSFPFYGEFSEGATGGWFKIIVEPGTSLSVRRINNNGLPCKVYRAEDIEEGNLVAEYKSDILTYKFKEKEYYIYIERNAMTDNQINILKIEDDSYENNDDVSNATEVKLNEWSDFTLSAINDYDWYTFDVKENGVLKISQIEREDKYYDNKSVAYEIYKGDIEQCQMVYSGMRFGVNDGNSDVNKSKGFKVEPNRYYIKIYRNDNVPYYGKIQFNFYKDDEYESNDNWEEAKAMPLGENFEINVQSLTEEDWFFVNVGKEGATLRLDIDAKNPAIPGMVNVDIYTSEVETNSTVEGLDYIGNCFGRRSDSNQKVYKATTETAVKLLEGKYYVKFTAPTLIEYDFIYDNTVLVKATLVNDEFENNDTMEKAKEIQLNSIQTLILDTLYIGGVVDKDWFKFTSTEAGIFQLNVLNENSGVNIDFYKEDGSKITDTLKTQCNGKWSYLLDEGTIYMRFTTISSSTRNVSRIKGQFIPTTIPYNGDINNAYEIEVGKQVELVCSHQVVQWLKFTIDTRRELTCSTKDANCVIYQSDGETEVKTTVYEPGTYYIKLTGNSTVDENKVMFLIDENAAEKVPTVECKMNQNEVSHISVMPKIGFEFSQNIDMDTLTKDNIKMYKGNQEIPINIEYYSNEKSLYVEPQTRLDYYTDYKIVLSYNIKNLEYGNKMNRSYSETFTTEENVVIPNTGKLEVEVKLPDKLKEVKNASLISANLTIKGDNYINSVRVDSGTNFIINLPVGEYEIQVDVPMMLSDTKKVTITETYDAYVELNPTIGDVNCDGQIDISDIVIVAKQYDNKSKVIGE